MQAQDKKWYLDKSGIFSFFQGNNAMGVQKIEHWQKLSLVNWCNLLFSTNTGIRLMELKAELKFVFIRKPSAHRVKVY